MTSKKTGGRDEKGFPGLKSSRPEAATRIEYQELQQNEILALEAIYGQDFVKHDDVLGAWKKADPSFDISIKAPADSDLAVTVGFVMTATYPKTPPLLTVKRCDNLREPTQLKIQHFIETQPAVFARDEQEMIDKIVEGLREILEDAAQAEASGKLVPSLEAERERHEADLAQQAREVEEQEARKKSQERKEKEKAMSESLQQQLDRQKQMAKESRLSRRSHGLNPNLSNVIAASHVDQIDFDQFCNTVDRTGNPYTFRSVSGKCDARSGPVCTVYTVRPVLAQGTSSQALALKEAVIRSGGRDPKDVKKQVQSLESRLEQLKGSKTLHHRHLVHVLDFKVESAAASSAWTVSVLSNLADKGSLDELLELAGNLELDKVRSWTRDLLDALGFLHNNNIAHQDIHPSNILLFRESTGEIVPKISDAWYQREIHNASTLKSDLPGLSSARSAYWLPPEIAAEVTPQYTYKTDIWDFGVVFVQMIFGRDVLQRYSSPKNLMGSLALSQPFEELVSRFFKEDKQKRPRAFELGSSEFLATDSPIFCEKGAGLLAPSPMAQPLPWHPPKLRRDSWNRPAIVSRYTADFFEEGRLGKGGFGEVVKARKKLNGQIYAIKKINVKTHGSLTEILKEVRLLSQLSHPAVVRYYDAWVEEVTDQRDTEAETATETDSEESEDLDSEGLDIQFVTSTGGLDFMSSNAPVEYGSDDEDGEDEDDDEDEDEDDEGGAEGREDGSSAVEGLVAFRNTARETQRRGSMLRSARFYKPYRSVIYISMEYCEKRTLRDLISRNLYKNTGEIWRLFRQILEGLAHMHGQSIVHRDLKPENIFISSGIDEVDNVKIGDFGLATSGQFTVDKITGTTLGTEDMTRSIGTAYYAAPEIRSAVDGQYSTKVDMYSLGIILFEMCYEPMLGMQKAEVIGSLRMLKPALPADFEPADKTQTEIVLALVSHDPKERPSCSQLLKSGKLPVPMESETIRRILAGLSDPTSPYYDKMLSTLFARPVDATRDYAWDMLATSPSPTELLQQGVVKSIITSIFRRHGALETPSSFIYPRSSYYGDNVVHVLDQNGTVLQLPYDLTLGHARMVAKQTTGVTKTFQFGNIFRDRKDTGQPQMFGEVDFDIVTSDALDLALKEVEVLKVLDEIVTAFPSLSSGQMCFHIGHSDLLRLIFEHCGIEPACRRAAAEVLSRLNVNKDSWQKIRLELRSPAVGISATSVDELQRFDFRDSPNKAFKKLKMLSEGSDMYQRASSTVAHLKEVVEYVKRFGLKTKVYINPLNSYKENFYVGGILFSCLYDNKARNVFAAGGRYDHLVKDQRPKIGGQPGEKHAVGFTLAWERLAQTSKLSDRMFSDKRCDALVASFDPALLRSTGIEVLNSLWAHDVSAELARDARSPKDLLFKYREESYSWIIIIKQDSMVKVKTMGRNDVVDVDMATSQLVAWVRSQIRDRDSRGGGSAKQRGGPHTTESAPGPSAGGSGGGGGISSGGGGGGGGVNGQDVKILVAQTRSKKFNRRTVVEQAQVSAANVVRPFLDGPILAVETSDEVMELIRESRLSDHESWRKVEQAVSTSERKYVREVHEQLEGWRLEYEKKNGPRHSFVYNFRTGNCLYYDLGD
ncbi:hypothetical protein CP532_6051 [Ophiocordyceps camponoti-leonardi (nom. inval.)]|nr:hypothetical protein CP532_6051 [Ophiocordyceps camponoti-leonardi (nom. inval.)]